MYGKMQESGLTESIPLICILTSRARILFFSILNSPRGALGGAGSGGWGGPAAADDLMAQHSVFTQWQATFFFLSTKESPVD